MKNRFISFLIIPLMMTIISGCWVYHPQSVDIPLLKEKSDLRIDGGVSIIPFSANSTISYGLTNHIAIQLYGGLNPLWKPSFQGALGYFKNLENLKTMELYTGYGEFEAVPFKDAPGEFYRNYKIFFTQFNFGKIDSQFTNREYGFGIKAGLIYSKLKENSRDSLTEPWRTNFYSNNGLLIEPNLFIRFGKNNLKLNVKLGTCLIIKDSNKFSYFPLNLGLSLNYRF